MEIYQAGIHFGASRTKVATEWLFIAQSQSVLALVRYYFVRREKMPKQTNSKSTYTILLQMLWDVTKQTF